MPEIQKDGHKYLVQENHKGRVYVYWEEYNCRMLLHFRLWYNENKHKPGATPDWRPSRWGIAVSEEKVQALLLAIQYCLQDDPRKQKAEAGANA